MHVEAMLNHIMVQRSHHTDEAQVHKLGVVYFCHTYMNAALMDGIEHVNLQLLEMPLILSLCLCPESRLNFPLQGGFCTAGRTHGDSVCKHNFQVCLTDCVRSPNAFSRF